MDRLSKQRKGHSSNRPSHNVAPARHVPTPCYFWIIACSMMHVQMWPSVQGSSMVFVLRFLPQLQDKFPDTLEETLGGMVFCLLTKSESAGAFQACKIVFD